MDRIIDESCCGVKIAIRDIDVCQSFVIDHSFYNTVYHMLHFRLVDINHPEGGEIRPAILEVIKIDSVSIKTCQKEEVSLADQTNLLTLSQNLLKDFLFTIDNNQVGLRYEDLFQYISVAIFILRQLFHNKSKLIHWTNSGGFAKYFLEGHHGVIVLVEDCDGLPVVSLNQIQVSLA